MLFQASSQLSNCQAGPVDAAIAKDSVVGSVGEFVHEELRWAY